MDDRSPGQAVPYADELSRLLHRWRLYADREGDPRARRAGDLIQFVLATVALIALGWVAEPPFGFAQSVDALLASIPTFLLGLWQWVIDTMALIAIALLVTAAVRRRWSLLRDIGAVAVVATTTGLIIGRQVEGTWADLWEALRSAGAPPTYLSLRVAVPAAVIMVVSPYLTRPWRRFARVLVPLAAFSAAAIGETTSLGAIASLCVATMAATVVHLVVGSAAGRPSLKYVGAALEQFGLSISTLGVADRQKAGYFLVEGTDGTGRPVIVKVYGRDAQDSQLLVTLWRTVWYREAGSPLRYGRLQQVEHEAFLTLLASKAGILTDDVVTAGATATDDALLVLARRGQPLPTDGSVTAAQVWATVTALHAAGITHGQLDEEHLVVEGDRVGVLDFRGATVAPSLDQRRADQAQVLVTTATIVGVEAAVAAAVAALGRHGVEAALSLLQPAALTPRQRRDMKDGRVDLDELRSAAAAAAGVEEPELVQLRRVSLGTIVRVVLPVIAIMALLASLSGLDWESLKQELRDADWWLVAVGFVLGQTPRLAQAMSTLGASPIRLPFQPVYALQLAISYVNLAIPTSAARVAVNIRFFQRHGLPPGSAVAIGAVDGFSGFLVQAMILVSILLFTTSTLDLSMGSDTSDGAASLLGWMVVAGIVALIVVVAVPKIRRAVLGAVKKLLHDGREALRGVSSPRRLSMLFGGNLLAELIFAMTLGVFCLAFGSSIPLSELLLTNVSTALLAGLLPIPGGMGVTEGGLIYGLTRAGMDQEAAVAAVITYRLATFYLPPIWGYFSFRWLERNKHL